jgi:hypothetical protein
VVEDDIAFASWGHRVHPPSSVAEALNADYRGALNLPK